VQIEQSLNFTEKTLKINSFQEDPSTFQGKPVAAINLQLLVGLISAYDSITARLWKEAGAGGLVSSQ
jgi:hypothetical protein